MGRRTAIVTGANRKNGVGLALIRELLEDGYEVVGTYRNKTNSHALLDLAAVDTRLTALRLDVSDGDSAAVFASQVASHFPHLDILVNNAGMPSSLGNIATAPISSLTLQMEVHAIGPIRITQAVLPLLRRARRPIVVVITSMLGSVSAIGAGWTHYAPSKAAANALSRQLAAVLRTEGICVCAVHPGWVDTDIGGPSAPISPEQSAHALLKLINATELKDSGTFRDVWGETLPW